MEVTNTRLFSHKLMSRQSFLKLHFFTFFQKVKKVSFKTARVSSFSKIKGRKHSTPNGLQTRTPRNSFIKAQINKIFEKKLLLNQNARKTRCRHREASSWISKTYKEYWPNFFSPRKKAFGIGKKH